MEIVIVLLISLLTAIFIALPFFLNAWKPARSGKEEGTPVDPLLERFRVLEGRKESLYSAIRDIDLDHGLGKLTEGDYQELRQKYRAEAASVLKEIDALTKDSAITDVDSQIEAEIMNERAPHPGGSEEEEIESEILRARKGSITEFSAPGNQNCPECGHRLSGGDVYCSKCGAKLK